MKTLFFPKLAWSGIKKNHKLYLPYILSCIGMIMMYCIIQSLADTQLVGGIPHSATVRTVLNLGKFVIAAFSLLFLFYTNSFLIRRRYKEFGLYNILGMDKRSIGAVIVYESLIVAAISLCGGILLGALFSKLAELGLLNAIHEEIDYHFRLPLASIGWTLLIYGVIFFLLTLKSLISVRRCDPLALLRRENAGEKPPKGNLFFALAGLLLLGAAYFIAVSIRSPLSALLLFFVAVLMVIAATYLLFISGSVVFCRLLRKNKKYYYKKEHFVSVSSMAYRMKRNGAGLASICILATMVLVMVSSTCSLYFGANDIMNGRYPKDCEISVLLRGMDDLENDRIGEYRKIYEKVFREYETNPKSVTDYRVGEVSGVLNGTTLDLDPADMESIFAYDRIRQLYFMNLEDYNRNAGTQYTLGENEALIRTLRCSYDADTLSVGDVTLKIAGQLPDTFMIGEAAVLSVSSILVVIPDFGEIASLSSMMNSFDAPVITWKYSYSYDSALSDEETISMYNRQYEELVAFHFEQDPEDGFGFSGGCLAEEKKDYFTSFGGLFFLGIILSIVFVFAAAMIIYYKQISEGYEDRSRFAIMQKVGMTKEDIKKSIDSQVLTVFFAPLVLAGIHLSFAFPLIWKILQLFSLQNLGYVILVTLCAFLCFALVYAVIYKLTAHAYYSIVSSNEER